MIGAVRIPDKWEQRLCVWGNSDSEIGKCSNAMIDVLHEIRAVDANKKRLAPKGTPANQYSF